MMENHSCENTKRIEDWMVHCRDQHSELNRLLREIHAALYGNGREGIMERVKSHSQRIALMDQDVRDLRKDVDDRLDKLGKNLGDISTRTWKIVVVMAVLVTVLNKSLPDMRSIIGL